MKKLLLTIAAFIVATTTYSQEIDNYTPSPQNIASRQAFSEDRFGIFLHWGIYSMYAQGEWFLQNKVPDLGEYAKAADAFYPHRFDARQWVQQIKASGAKYICLTSRHHDGFSMWNTNESDYNIVKATPFKRDVIKELAEACHAEGIALHLYYSHVDWGRDDYPMGRTGRNCGKDSLTSDWSHYYQFMNNQLTELLTNYGPIRCIWFDGWWDHDSDPTPFDWQLDEQYALIHRLQPACLIGNNHHMTINPGEDIQIFERDLPGENTAGFAAKAAQVSRLPLETCETMNGMWGYKVTDTNYKSASQIIRLLVNTAGKGANLLLNIGPQPNGELPAVAVSRLREVGEWMKLHGETIYGTEAGPVKPCEWGASTCKNGITYLHVLKAQPQIEIPFTSTSANGKKAVRSVTARTTGQKLPYVYKKGMLTISLPEGIDDIDYIIELK